MRLIVTAASAFLFAAMMAASASAATKWNAVPDPNAISWVATDGSGSKIDGRCTKFNSDIAFDPDDLGHSHVRVEIDMASCRTGEAQKDTYLPQQAWFDIATFPVAVFQADSFKHEGGDKYVANGTLTLKGVSMPVALPFTLDRQGDTAHVTGETVISRLSFGVGNGDMASGQVAGPNVTIKIDLKAKSAGEAQ